MTNVLKFDPVIVGEGYRFDSDDILEEAKGNNFDRLCVLGEADGELWLSGNANAGEILILLERAKRLIVFGEN